MYVCACVVLVLLLCITIIFEGHMYECISHFFFFLFYHSLDQERGGEGGKQVGSMNEVTSQRLL